MPSGGRPDDPAGDLAAVGHEHRLEHPGGFQAAGPPLARDLAKRLDDAGDLAVFHSESLQRRAVLQSRSVEPPTRSSKALAAGMIRLPTGGPGSVPRRQALAADQLSHPVQQLAGDGYCLYWFYALYWFRSVLLRLLDLGRGLRGLGAAHRCPPSRATAFPATRATPGQDLVIPAAAAARLIRPGSQASGSPELKTPCVRRGYQAGNSLCCERRWVCKQGQSPSGVR